MTEESSDRVGRKPVEKVQGGGRSVLMQVFFGTIVGVAIVCVLAAWLVHRPSPPAPGRLACRANLQCLGLAMLVYASDHGDVFPVPDRWCDLLRNDNNGIRDDLFCCRSAGPGRCHYAMNPDANPRSDPDTVLLFESGSGWNQAGGPELLTTEYHDGCNVAFVDGTVRFVKPEEIIGLKWSDAERQPSEVRNARRPRNDEELRYWLENMVCFHDFSTQEIRAATGLTHQQILTAQRKFNIVPGARSFRRADAPLLVLPYPGGRHPRIGFLEGAVDPQREAKFSVFTPWDPNSYVVVDVPEAIWSNLGLTYLAHTHIDTVWTQQGIELPKLEWNCQADGSLDIRRTLPNGIKFGVAVVPGPDAVRMEMWLENGSTGALTDLRVQNCVMPRMAAGFAGQTNDNKVLTDPYVACRSEDGGRWIVTAWEGCDRPWGNADCPCFHSDPKFPDLEPGQRARLRGWLSFYEGADLQAEFARIEATGWRK